MAIGDHLLVQSRIPGILHCGIDTGDGTVVHVSGKTPSQAKIFEISLADFADGQIVRKAVYNIACYPPDTVVQRARMYVGQPFLYTLDESNCEHFATWCKTNIWISQQAETAKSTINNVLAFAGLAFFGGFVLAELDKE